MSAVAIRRELSRDDPDLVCQGLRRLSRWLGPDLEDVRPTAFASRREELADLEPRLVALSHSEHDAVRELVADALGAFTGAVALERVLALSEDPSERVRASAIGALEAWPESAAAEEQLLISLSAGHWTVRMQAARALRRFRGREVAMGLLDGLTDPDSYVRHGCSEALLTQDPADFLQTLRKIQREYPATHLLDATIDLLGAVGTEEDAAFLSKVGGWFNLSQPRFIRDWARQAARRIRARHKQRLSSK
jgi:HEAT repeat protein